MADIGLIGVGLLGTAMAERWIGREWSVAGYDPDPAARQRLKALGGMVMDSAEEVAASAWRVVLSLPHSGIGAEVIGAIEGHLAAGTVVIDTTTGSPEEMEGFGRRLKERDVWYLDATVGGNSTQARIGDVIVLVGGDKHGFAVAFEVLEVIGKRVFHLGECGAGARMKLVLNLALGLHRAVLAEALTFAEKSGFDGRQALEVLCAGPSYSRVMDIKGERMLKREFAPEARLSQHLKDVRLILKEGERLGARLPLSEVHCGLLEIVEGLGHGGSDNSAVIEAYANH